MQHRLTFGSWELPKGTEPAADQARAWASLHVSLKLPAAAQGQQGGANLSSAENLDAALELTRMFRATRESEKRNTLALAGATYILSTAALELLKGNWGALRSLLGVGEAEDVVLVENFLENIEEFDPNEKPQTGKADAS